MKDSGIPKNLLFGELASGKRASLRPSLLFEDVCTRDLLAGGFNPAEIETATSDRQKWRAMTHKLSNAAEVRRNTPSEEKKTNKKATRVSATPNSLQMHDLWQILWLSHWTLMSHRTLQLQAPSNVTTSIAQLYHHLPRSTVQTKKRVYFKRKWLKNAEFINGMWK